MAWIETIDYENARGKLQSLYKRVKRSDNYIDNILKVHSLRPNTLEGHMYMYKNVLHHSRNTLPKWLLETLGVFVSMLNGCDYCVKHHFQGMKKLLNDEPKAEEIQKALEKNEPDRIFEGRELALLRYAEALTKAPGEVSEKVVEVMKETGLDDGEILEANQVISYFNYANRTVLGLGVNLSGDILGLSPSESENPENWSHG